MSSDARIWHTDPDGTRWVGNHDPMCEHYEPLPFHDKLEEIEKCAGRCWRWVLAHHNGESWLKGYHA